MDSDYYDTDYATEAPLPTPRGTPYDRSPLSSRLPSRGPSPFPNANPPPGLTQNRWSNSHHLDGGFDENISILDPRRFTPTLHANLVAEILSLRRDLESKNNLVEQLENDLDQARDDQETAAANVAASAKEVRDVKRQLARAESDDAVTAVAQERDEAVEALAEMKKQLERMTKSRRAAEEDLDQLRQTAERDVEKFEETKRAFERRAHVAEGRLKAVMDELAVSEAMKSRPQSLQRQASHRSHQRIMSEDYGDFQSDTASIRSSVMSIRHRPTSLMMGDDQAEKLGISLHGTLKTNGKSLADELNFDESEEDEGSGSGTETEVEEPADLLTDTESLADIDELPELPSVVEVGVQVISDVDYEARCTELEGLLKEKATELTNTYDALEIKSTDMLLLHILKVGNPLQDNLLAFANLLLHQRMLLF